jgi:hypothetical protein
MSLLGLAVVGRDNEPLYLCDCAAIVADNTGADKLAPTAAAQHAPEMQQDDSTSQPQSADDDPLGIGDIIKCGDLRSSLSFEYSLMIHSALDELHEAIDTTEVGLPVPKGRMGPWLGVLRVQDEVSIYGYITATNIKFLVLAHESAKEAEIRSFSTEIHEAYVGVSDAIHSEITLEGLVAAMVILACWALTYPLLSSFSAVLPESSARYNNH